MGEYRTLSMKEINAYLKAPDTIVDEAFLAHCKRHVGYLIPQFSDLATSTDLRIRYNAAWLLVHLNYHEGIGRILSFINDATQYLNNSNDLTSTVSAHKSSWKQIQLLRKKAIVTIGDLPFSMSEQQQQYLLDTLLSILKNCSDPEVFDKSICIISCLTIPGAADKLEQAFDKSSGIQMCYYAITMAIWCQNPKAHEIIHYLLTARDQPFAFNEKENSADTWRLLFVYLDYTPTEKIDLNIIQSVRTFICNSFMSTDSVINSRIVRCLECIPIKLFPDYSEFLDNILNSRLDKKVKTIAILRLAEISKHEGIKTVFTILNQNNKDMDAANILSQLTADLKKSDDKNDKQLISDIRESLIRFIEEDPYLLTGMYGDTYPYWETLMAVCKTDHILIEKYSFLQDPVEHMRLYAIARNINSNDIISFLLNTNILPEIKEDSVEKFSLQWNSQNEHFYALHDLLSEYGRICNINVKCAEVPPDYREVLAKIEDMTREYFSIVEFIQQWNDKPKLHEVAVRMLSGRSEVPGPDYYNINIKALSRSYSYKISGLGYDFAIQEFLNILNDVLAKAGLNERLFQLYGRGLTCSIAFAPANAFIEMANQFHLPVLADDSNIDHTAEPPVKIPLIWQGYSKNYLGLISDKRFEA